MPLGCSSYLWLSILLFLLRNNLYFSAHIVNEVKVYPLHFVLQSRLSHVTEF